MFEESRAEEASLTDKTTRTRGVKVGNQERSQQTPGIAPEGFDLQFRAQTQSALLNELWAEAWGEEYPAEVAPFSSCSWSVLGEMISALKLRPGQRLVDLGCGTGGAGLWLARAFDANLVGVDFSEAAIELATARANHWLPADRAEFRVGSFESTGLPDGCADAAVSLDALPLSRDLDAALAELRRLLSPEGTAAFTVSEPTSTSPEEHEVASWGTRLRQAGLEVERRLEHPETAEYWRRLYELAETNRAELRREMGDQPTENLLYEARTLGPSLDHLRWLLLVVSRPSTNG